jgi:hypothetical protein
MPKRAPKKATAATAPQQLQMTELPFTYNENAPEIYTDGVRMLATQFSVVLVLQQMELGPDGQPRAKHVGTIHMSPQHADALLGALKLRSETPAPG